MFLAEQSAPVKRKVALKVIKPGMDTRTVPRHAISEPGALLTAMTAALAMKLYDAWSAAKLESAAEIKAKAARWNHQAALPGRDQ